MKGKRYYGLHFSEGISSFANTDKLGFVSFDQALAMNESMSGIPMFIDHDESNPAVGIVVKSFLNKFDGKIWCEFLLFDEDAQALVDKGWTLSNAYDYDVLEESGHYHGVDYQFSVANGSYNHLALVSDARYAESKILTPEEFDIYNKELEKQTTVNSKGVDMFKNFKITSRKTANEKDKEAKVEATNKLLGEKVTLPKTGRTLTVNELVAEVDARDYMGYEASLEDYVHIDGIKVTIGELLAKLEEVVGADKTPQEVLLDNPAPASTESSETANADDKEDKKDKEESENEDEDKDKEDSAEEKNKAKNSFFNKLQNADRKPAEKVEHKPSYATNSMKVDAGRSKYGRAK